MRQYLKAAARSAAVVIVAVAAAFAAAFGATITAAVNLAAIALIVPGTGTPNPAVPPLGTNYMQNAVSYLHRAEGFVMHGRVHTRTGPLHRTVLAVPLRGWGGLNGAKWDVSVASGVASLNTQIAAVDPPTTSWSSAIRRARRCPASSNANWHRTVAASYPTGSRSCSSEIRTANGGLFERLAALGTVPILDATFGQPTPTDTTVLPAVNTTDIAFQYDGVADFPKYPINLLADLNAIAGFWYIHGTYLAPKGTDRPPRRLRLLTARVAAGHRLRPEPKNCQTYNDTLYITIPPRHCRSCNRYWTSVPLPVPPH